jgi:hypothetical protein
MYATARQIYCMKEDDTRGYDFLRMPSRHYSDRPRTVPAASAEPARLMAGKQKIKVQTKTSVALARQSHKMDGAYKGDSNHED